MSDRERPSEPTDTNGFGPRRRSNARLLFSVGIAATAFLALRLYQPDWFSASALPGGNPAPTALAGPVATPTPAPTPKPPSYPYIGGSQTSSENSTIVKITLRDVQYAPGGNGRVANKGNVFVVVTLRIENRQQGKDYPFSPNVNCQLQTTCNFYVQDNQGEKNPPIPYDPAHTALRAVVLQPGGRQEGSYTFEVPARDAHTDRLRLLWYPSPLLAPDTIYHWILTGDRRHER
jgi:hypothetical protein